jgi:hypothetical protein
MGDLDVYSLNPVNRQLVPSRAYLHGQDIARGDQWFAALFMIMPEPISVNPWRVSFPVPGASFTALLLQHPEERLTSLGTE